MMIRRLLSFLLCIGFLPGVLASATAQQHPAPSAEIPVARFSAGDMNGWKDQVVYGTKNATTYTLVRENGRQVLMARSADGASGLIRKIEVDPRTHPIISWSWKIDHTVKKGNERSKEGHDFAARLYVVFPRGFFSSTRAIEYVWGNVMHKEERMRSPYSRNMFMIAVDTGNDLAGHWTTHRRNYADDYRAAFGEEPPRLGAVAIMTDSDNTHEVSVGYYGDITILPAGKDEPDRRKEQKQREPAVREPSPGEQQKKEQKPHEAPPNEQPDGSASQGPAGTSSPQREPSGKGVLHGDKPTPNPL
jgi:hypothetical protein